MRGALYTLVIPGSWGPKPNLILTLDLTLALHQPFPDPDSPSLFTPVLAPLPLNPTLV